MIQDMLEKTLTANKSLTQKLEALEMNPERGYQPRADARLESEINNLRLTLNDKINQNIQ
jgi:hypothetical protein